MSTFDLDPYKIPAFKRKKQIEREVAKKIPWTALDRQRQGLLKEQNRTIDKKNHIQSARKIRRKVVDPVPELSSPVPDPKSSTRCEIIGEVIHYLSIINVAVVRLHRSLKKGSLVAFEEDSGLFFQPVDSMQINRKDVVTAKKGSEIGMKVTREPKIGGKMYLSTI